MWRLGTLGKGQVPELEVNQSNRSKSEVAVPVLEVMHFNYRGQVPELKVIYVNCREVIVYISELKLTYLS